MLGHPAAGMPLRDLGTLSDKIAVSVNWALKYAVNIFTKTTCSDSLVYKFLFWFQKHLFHRLELMSAPGS